MTVCITLFYFQPKNIYNTMKLIIILSKVLFTHETHLKSYVERIKHFFD